MTYAESDRRMWAGVAMAMGERMLPGCSIGHPSDECIHELIRIDGADAVCRHGRTNQVILFPAAECFDVNKARRMALATLPFVSRSETTEELKE